MREKANLCCQNETTARQQISGASFPATTKSQTYKTLLWTVSSFWPASCFVRGGGRRNAPSSLCILALTDRIVSKGETRSSNAAPVNVSMYSSIILAPQLILKHTMQEYWSTESKSLPLSAERYRVSKANMFLGAPGCKPGRCLSTYHRRHRTGGTPAAGLPNLRLGMTRPFAPPKLFEHHLPVYAESALRRGFRVKPVKGGGYLNKAVSCQQKSAVMCYFRSVCLSSKLQIYVNSCLAYQSRCAYSIPLWHFLRTNHKDKRTHKTFVPAMAMTL